MTKGISQDEHYLNRVLP